MRKIKQVDRPYLIWRHREGKQPVLWTACRTQEAAEYVADDIRSAHPMERVEVIKRSA